MEFRYTYLFLGLLFGLVWLILYVLLPKTRKEILFVSILLSIAGPIMDYFYFQDWWKPVTLSGSYLSFEALMTAFFLAGVSSIVYYLATKKNEDLSKVNLLRDLNWKYFFIIVFSLLFLIPIVFFLTGRDSFLATIIPVGIMVVYMLVKRKDLIRNSIFSGFLLLLVAFLLYYVLDLINPGWVEEFWIAAEGMKIKVFSLPLNDVFWYFLGGMYMGPLFEFLYGKR